MKVMQYTAMMMLCFAASAAVALATGGMRWWGYAMVGWLACAVVTMLMMWWDERRWAQVDAANDGPVPNMPGYDDGAWMVPPAKKTNDDGGN